MENRRDRIEINMEQLFDVIIPMTMDNMPLFKINIEWIRKNIAQKRIVVLGAEALREPVISLGAEFINEDSLIEGMTLQAVKDNLSERIRSSKRAGWYFQQFLKLGYAEVCKDEYYIVWDSDTVPLHEIRHIIDGYPVFTQKEEMEPAYFETLDRLFSGKVKRYGDFSFICENMIIKTALMKEMLEDIMNQPELRGRTFWERILDAVSDENLSGSGFSEFETYGNYVMTYYPDLYHFRTLRGMRKGAEYFGMNPNREELLWAAQSYDTIAFERWSHHHKMVGRVCSTAIVRKMIPFSWFVNMKEKISELRGRGREK